MKNRDVTTIRAARVEADGGAEAAGGFLTCEIGMGESDAPFVGFGLTRKPASSHSRQHHTIVEMIPWLTLPLPQIID
jgi:hypothetical protein